MHPEPRRHPEFEGEIALACGCWREALALYTRIPEPYSIGWTHFRLAATPRPLQTAEHREPAQSLGVDRPAGPDRTASRQGWVMRPAGAFRRLNPARLCMNDFPEQFLPENQNPWYGPAHGQFSQAHLPRASIIESDFFAAPKAVGLPPRRPAATLILRSAEGAPRRMLQSGDADPARSGRGGRSGLLSTAECRHNRLKSLNSRKEKRFGFRLRIPWFSLRFSLVFVAPGFDFIAPALISLRRPQSPLNPGSRVASSRAWTTAVASEWSRRQPGVRSRMATIRASGEKIVHAIP